MYYGTGRKQIYNDINLNKIYYRIMTKKSDERRLAAINRRANELRQSLKFEGYTVYLQEK